MTPESPEAAGIAFPPAVPVSEPAHTRAPKGDDAGDGQAVRPVTAARNTPGGEGLLRRPARGPHSSPLTPFSPGEDDGRAREEAPGMLRPAGASPAKDAPGAARPLAAAPGGARSADAHALIAAAMSGRPTVTPLAGIPNWPAAPDPSDIYVQMRLGLEPVTASRPRVSPAEYTVIGGERIQTRKAHGYHRQALKRYQETVGWLLRQGHVKRNDVDDLGVHVIFHVPGMQRRDVDNLVKALLDACNGITWRDDQQISRLTTDVVRNSDDPHVDLVIYVTGRRARGCPKCGKALTAKQISIGAIYCSKSCYDTAQRKGTYRACTACGVTVYRRPDKAAAKEVFCSPTCRTAGRGSCRECGQPNDKAWSGRRFCSTECSVKWHKRRLLAATTRPVGTCSDCGGPTYSVGSERCRACFIAHRSLSGQSPKRKPSYDACPDCGGRKRATSLRCFDCFQKTRPRKAKEAA